MDIEGEDRIVALAKVVEDEDDEDGDGGGEPRDDGVEEVVN
jgi:hypothetical protein